MWSEFVRMFLISLSFPFMTEADKLGIEWNFCSDWACRWPRGLCLSASCVPNYGYNIFLSLEYHGVVVSRSLRRDQLYVMPLKWSIESIIVSSYEW